MPRLSRVLRLLVALLPPLAFRQTLAIAALRQSVTWDDTPAPSDGDASSGAPAALNSTPAAQNVTQWRQPVLQRGLSAVVVLDIGGQRIDVLLDTGSFDLVLASALCKSCGGRVFRTTESRTFHFEQPLEMHTFSYGSGNIEAIKGYDNVSAGPYRAPRMPFWLISSLDENVQAAWAPHEFEGLLGLGLKRSTVSDALGIRNFSLCLARGGGGGGLLGGGGGVLYWNGRDEGLPWGTPQPVAQTVRDSGLHWELQVPYISLGAARLCDRRCRVVLDAGTALVAVPWVDSRDLALALPAVPPNCSLLGLPSLRVDLPRGGVAELPPSSYVARLSGGDEGALAEMALRGRIAWRPAGQEAPGCTGPSCGTAAVKDSLRKPPRCAAVLMVSKGPRWILGLPFFREHAVHFDRAAKQVTLAESGGGGCSEGDRWGGDGAPAQPLLAAGSGRAGGALGPEIEGRQVLAALA